jgi:hypothetical protein
LWVCLEMEQVVGAQVHQDVLQSLWVWFEKEELLPEAFGLLDFVIFLSSDQLAVVDVVLSPRKHTLLKSDS